MSVLRYVAPTLIVIALPVALQAQEFERPWLDEARPVEERVSLLLEQMTTDEKIAILHGPMAMPIFDFAIPEGAIGSAGFIPGNERLGIPALQETDASLGVTNPMMMRGAQDMSTPLPSSLALAATFDPRVAFAGGQMVATEARAKGMNVQLAGGVNLARDPRNGRNFEYLGEDPLLAGILSGQAVRGIQSLGMISTLKHFALNGQEHNRMTADSVIGEAAARESDLLAFQIAIEISNPGSIMCAYNLINGDYGCENEWLLNTVLKQDWDYDGFVMSDWGAVHSLGALVDGLDQQSGEQLDPQVWFDGPLRQGLSDGTVAPARVDDAVSRILRAMFANGLFEQPTISGTIDFEANALIALDQAEQAIVLLQNNDDILPLSPEVRRIAVIGGHADAGVPSGGGSSQVTNPYREEGALLRTVPIGGEGMMSSWNTVVFHPSSPLTQLREQFPDAQISFDTGAYPSSAAAAAAVADIAIVFTYQPSSEGYDVPDMGLPLGQNGLVEAVAAANSNTVVVLQTGNPVHMPWADDVQAVIQAWYGGARGGEAIANIIAGDVNPSGRLPLSWPVDEGQLPRPVIPGAGAAADARVIVDYTIEGSDVGYRWFAREDIDPRYWFGYGLTYTDFGYSDLELSGGEALGAQVTVTNQGKRAGQDVVQFYLTATPDGASRRLLGFQKVDLAPGESQRVLFEVDPRLLADFDAEGHRWIMADGVYGAAIGTDAGSMVLTGSVDLNGRTMKP